MDIQKLINLSDEELLVVLEAARIALSDGEMFYTLAAEMDISDSFMCEVRDKLEKEMNQCYK